VSDTELNELAVMPTKLLLAESPLRAPGANVVMTVTPVAKRESACLKCGVSKSGLNALM
jgi:hypothetical protein